MLEVLSECCLETLEPYVQFALLAGPNVEGLSTCASDLDVLLVLDDRVPTEALQTTRGFMVEGFRLDVLMMSVS